MSKEINVDEINSKEDFLRFIRLLIEDKEKNEWENNDLDSYFRGIEGFVNDIEGYWKNKNKESEYSRWKLFAEILMAATVYE